MPDETRENSTEIQSVHLQDSDTAFYLLFLEVSGKKTKTKHNNSEKPINFSHFHEIWTLLHLLSGIQRHTFSTSTASFAKTTAYPGHH